MRSLDSQPQTCRLRVVAFVLLAAAALPARAGPLFFDLGTLGGAHSASYGLNSAGQVVGGSSPSNGNEWEGFLYTGRPGPGGSMTSLGVLSGRISYANGINDSGQIVGTTAVLNNTTERAFVYVGTPGQGGHMIDLTPSADFGVRSQGEAINASGQVAGTYSDQTGTHAFRYTGAPGAGALAHLGTLGGLSSYGRGINDSGQVVGYSELAPDKGDFHAFLYTGTPGAGGAMRDLGTLAGFGNSAATAVGPSGRVVGWSDLPNLQQHAFVYVGTPGVDGHMIDLGALGGRYSGAFGINSSGDIVGRTEYDGYGFHAFLYTGGPMIDLDAWVHAADPASSDGYTLVEAYEITDGGLITGLAVKGDPFSGPSRAVLIDAGSLLPEPGAMLLLAPAAAGLLRRRPRRQTRKPSSNICVAEV
jgi:probable HAF family extracellular repeat protein